MRMISREDLKQRVMGHFCGSCSTPYKDTDILELGEYCCDMVSDTMAFIDELPTIEAEPEKHGRWIGWNCSECGKSTTHVGAKWCPVCGAKMDGDNE